MGNSASASQAQQGQRLPPYAVTTGVSGLESGGKRNNKAPNDDSYYVPVDEEVLPVATAVAAAPGAYYAEGGALPPAYNPSHQQQHNPRAPEPSASAPTFIEQSRSTAGSPVPVHTGTAPSSNFPAAASRQRQQPVVLFLRRGPTAMARCPACGASNVKTRTTTSPNWATWATAAGILLVCWPACWVPLVVDQAKRTDHYCPRCRHRVGSIGPYQDCCVTTRGR